ncbi:hypothetical protein FHS18_005502 [Paenibacillus phyllosphaerae]|uniref:Uncharacterized protein n=1 Tax=Paenibacillus phyllosphaerae TaxID=274593 RepID=A0A7W5B2T5_9BACL|nr:hypothetical protein [Paenibacillus phyllosphaerae]
MLIIRSLVLVIRHFFAGSIYLSSALPIREFQRATEVNFVPQFIFYPMLFTWFILLFPDKRSLFTKIMHYILFVSIMVWFIYFTAKYSDIYKFLGGTEFSRLANGYVRNFLQFAGCHLYISWFFKKEIVAEE